MYPQEIVQPMKNELINNGFEEMLTAADVDVAMQLQGTTLVVINSVCGCSAGACRPAAILAANHAGKRPNHFKTCFAGFDIDAVKKLREHLAPIPPTSPAMFLLQDGKVVSTIMRQDIEGKHPQILAQHLVAEFDKYCS